LVFLKGFLVLWIVAKAFDITTSLRRDQAINPEVRMGRVNDSFNIGFRSEVSDLFNL